MKTDKACTKRCSSHRFPWKPSGKKPCRSEFQGENIKAKSRNFDASHLPASLLHPNLIRLTQPLPASYALVLNPGQSSPPFTSAWWSRLLSFPPLISTCLSGFADPMGSSLHNLFKLPAVQIQLPEKTRCPSRNLAKSCLSLLYSHEQASQGSLKSLPLLGTFEAEDSGVSGDVVSAPSSKTWIWSDLTFHINYLLKYC